MNKIIRFKEMTVVIPMKDGEAQDEIEDRLCDAIDSAGARFITYKIETEEEEEE